MYLKSLEITGFKSFAEKIGLNFSSGITAVVGPNGCGKSNLVDAIRWALGEQSVRIMRGSKMDDLIFNGTSGRKPLNYAEVSLVFDRADRFLPVDYQEVALTRRVFRSGEGEYFLNKAQCRLKDITELFWDTGIGTETYSLIGQGRIDQMINARPDEHRELFEEAARIHRYKQKRKESRARLDEMEQNLLRVEDLLAELKNQEEGLSEAAALAGRYREILIKLQNVEQKIAGKRWWDNKNILQRLQDERQKIEGKLLEKKNALLTLEERCQKIAVKESIKSEEKEKLQSCYNSSKGRKESLENQLSLFQQQSKYMKEKIRVKEDSCREIDERISGLEETRKKNETELKSVLLEQEELGKKAAEIKDRLTQLQAERNVLNLETLRQKKTENDLKKVSLGQSLEADRLRCDELSERINELDKGIKKATEEIEKLQTVQNKIRGFLQRQEIEQEDREEKHRLLKQHFKEFEERAKARKASLDVLQKEMEKKEARIKYLKESQDSFDFYAGGVRAIMKASAHNPLLQGIYGPVADLINVPHGLEKALEAALGAKIQFIVTRDDETARRAIEYLKKNRAGKATFLPLNLLKTPGKRELPNAFGEDFLGVASQLVSVHQQYKKAVENLLGRVLVLKNLEAALKLTRSNRAGWSMVTLDGEVITPGGAISGGYHSQERTGFLGRKGELNTLEADILKIGNQQKDLEKDIEGLLNHMRGLENDLIELDLLGRKAENEKTRLQSELEKTDTGILRVEHEVKRLEGEKAKLKNKHDNLQRQILQKEKELQLLEEACSIIINDLEKMSSMVRVDEEQVKKLEKESVDIRVRFSALQEKESSLQEALGKQAEEKERLDLLLARLAEERGRLSVEMRHLETEKAGMLAELEKAKGEVCKNEELLFLLGSELSSLKKERSSLSLDLQKEQRAIEKIERRLQNLALELIKAEEAGKYLEEQLLEKFKINPRQDFPPQFLSMDTEEQLKKEKAFLEEQIIALGDVDPGVAEEYERLQKRIAFLEEQKNDLLKGEKGVRKVLAELDQHMKRRFLEALSAIENNFFDIFRKLFGGGQAFLKLTSPEDVLESGIEIIAQPPGKKLQSISLLSGGEKALTAIALLFALLQFRPVPFCVLDEIDSALDENNLERFVRYLKKYSGGTQFILITHRRKTMEEADVLLGITMEEQGVSKVVTLNLNKKAG
ncbi:MAG: chromosome segregation protein SMC [Dethiobacteria bacterium]